MKNEKTAKQKSPHQKSTYIDYERKFKILEKLIKNSRHNIQLSILNKLSFIFHV